MSFRIGDGVFGVNGIPGIVQSQDRVTGDLQIDTDEKEVAKVHRHGYINGLTPNERDAYNSHLDEVKQVDDPNEKITAMKAKITELQKDPSKIKMVKYLESELFHIMQTHNISPRFYGVETPKAPLVKA